MKKIFIVSLLVLCLPAFATDTMYTEDIVGACSAGFPKHMNATYELRTTECASGYFLPANSDTCAPCPAGYTCPGGTYTLNYVKSSGLTPVADSVITTAETNACSANFPKFLNAVYVKPSVDCASGYFLPAGSNTCAPCPTGFTCPGGTYNFNQTQSGGLTPTNNNLITTAESNACSANFPKFFNAVYNTVGYTCTSGQYLPKNTTACVACPNGYTCAGGTYNLDANNDQGIVGNTITVIWNGATAEDVAANNAGTVVYGGDIRTPVRPDPSQIPVGKRFVGWTFRKTNN